MVMGVAVVFAIRRGMPSSTSGVRFGKENAIFGLSYPCWGGCRIPTEAEQSGCYRKCRKVLVSLYRDLGSTFC